MVATGADHPAGVLAKRIPHRELDEAYAEVDEGDAAARLARRALHEHRAGAATSGGEQRLLAFDMAAARQLVGRGGHRRLEQGPLAGGVEPAPAPVCLAQRILASIVSARPR